MEISEIKHIKEKFYELNLNCADLTKNKNNIYQILKQYISDNSTINNNKVNFVYSENTKELKNLHSLKLCFKTKLIKKDITNQGNKLTSENIYSGLENICNSVMEKMSSIFLTELNKIKNCLLEFGRDIERIFMLPLSHLTTKVKLKLILNSYRIAVPV